MNKMKLVMPRFFGAVALSVLLLTPAFALAKEAETGCALSKRAMRHAIKRSEELISTYLGNVEEKMGATDQYGFSIAVSACGKIVWTETYGYADLENSVLISDKTKFRVGSVSKTLTATALGQLVETGRLDLDKEVQEYVPEFPVKEHPITVRQIAGHLAGIRHYDGEEFLSAKPYTSVGEGLSIFADDPLINEPGTTFAYSTYGWNLMSAVVESASGEEFLDYMGAQVFSKAGMTNTVADINLSVIPERTRFYHFDEENGENKNAPYVDNSNKWAGGGFLSTPMDLLHFAHAMFDGGLVEPETLLLLTTSQTTKSGEPTNNGIGWFTNMAPRELERAKEFYSEENMERIKTIIGADRIIGHSGGSVGGLTLFIAAPDSDGDIVVAGVSNNSAFFPAFALPVAAEFIDASKAD